MTSITPDVDEVRLYTAIAKSEDCRARRPPRRSRPPGLGWFNVQHDGPNAGPSQLFCYTGAVAFWAPRSGGPDETLGFRCSLVLLAVASDCRRQLRIAPVTGQETVPAERPERHARERLEDDAAGRQLASGDMIQRAGEADGALRVHEHRLHQPRPPHRRPRHREEIATFPPERSRADSRSRPMAGASVSSGAGNPPSHIQY